MKKLNGLIFKEIQITICDRLGGGKMYKTVVIEYSPKADDMAQKVEGTAKAILVFKKGLKKSFI